MLEIIKSISVKLPDHGEAITKVFFCSILNANVLTQAQESLERISQFGQALTYKTHM